MGRKLVSLFFLSFLLVGSWLSFVPLVKADSSFGKTDVGSVHGHPGGDALHGSKFTLSEDGTVTKISWYGDDNDQGGNATCGIYDDSGTGGDAGNLVVSSSEISVSNSLEWQEHSVSYVFLSAGDYWIYLFHEEIVSFTRENTGTGGVRSLVYNGLPDPFGTQTGEVREWSIFANYTTDEGQDLTFPLFENVKVWDSVSKSIELHNPLFQNFNMWASLTTSKEQAFSLFEPFNVWSSLSHTTEGIAYAYTFTLFETLFPFASMSSTVGEAYVLEDALALAAIAFVLAIVAICLLFALKK